MVLQSVPFLVQIHGLQLRAMNRDVGVMLGALFGGVLMVECNGGGCSGQMHPFEGESVH